MANEMQHKYGYFEDYQVDNYKVKLHKELFWLLLYKDPETKESFPHLNYDKYFTGLMKKLNGLNELLMFPVEMVSIMSLLEAAYIETQKECFDYKSYRKLILDAHNLVDKMNSQEVLYDKYRYL